MGKSSKKSRANITTRKSRQRNTKNTTGTINKHKAPPIKAISNQKITNPKILEQYNNLYNAKFLGQIQRMKQRIRLERASKKSKLKQIKQNELNDSCVIC